MASNYLLSDKLEYPYFLRTMPTDTTQIETIIALFLKFNWKKGIIVYSADDFGNGGYQRIITAGSQYNISFYAISVPVTATLASQVNDSTDAIINTLTQRNAPVFVYYTQYACGTAVRQGLYDRGYYGKDYVTILTVPIAGPYFGGLSSTLNDGAIAMTIPPPSNSVWKNLLASWKNTSSNPYPVQKNPALITDWLGVDCILAFALAADKLLRNGIAFDDIKGELLLNTLRAMNFTGTSGQVFFDANGDRLG
eukprot:Phypoly_transcript_11647.p1 GENE.Phypoly_transcript_11647~~Phypoly_transcript_11647.p1  ORF type:complete len:290 (+),score=22.30 Phypoly_transcript_11647:115-870(+)